MKIKIIENSKIPKYLEVTAITLYPFIFLNCTKQEAIDSKVLNHEYVHILQIEKFGIFKFYLLYLVNYFRNLLKYKNKQEAYRNILFEVEAYNLQDTIELPKDFL